MKTVGEGCRMRPERATNRGRRPTAGVMLPSRGLGERCELPQRHSGRCPDRPIRFSTIFSTQEFLALYKLKNSYPIES